MFLRGSSLSLLIAVIACLRNHPKAGLRLHAASHLATLYTSAGEHAAGINCLKAVLARTKGPAVTGEAAMAAYFSVHFQLAELLGPKRNEEALSVLRKGCVCVCD